MIDDKRALGMFEITTQAPAAWLEHANTLRIASRPIWDEFFAGINRSYSDNPRLEKLAYVRGYMILNGIAVENLLKALAVKRGEITALNGMLDSKDKVFFNYRGGHSLTKIAETLKINLTSDERDILGRLEEYLRSARYPVPKKADEYYTARDEERLQLLPTDPGVIEGLFKKVSELIEVNLTI